MGLLYYALRWPLGVALRVYFRKIYIANQDRIPAKGPVLIACNHPNSFMEAIILACFMDRSTHFIVRGDVFKKSWIAYLLRQTHQIPIYRFRDGFSNLKKNESTLEHCYQKLAEGEMIIIFSEGLCIQEKRLRPIQKGTARMAFGSMEEKGVRDLVVLPVGVNYLEGTLARTKVMCAYGEPLYLEDYREAYALNPNKAVKDLTQAIESEMKRHVVHIEGEEEIVDVLLEIQANEYKETFLPVLDGGRERLDRELALTRLWNGLTASQRMEWKEKILTYSSDLQSLGIKDAVVGANHKGPLPILLKFVLLAIPGLVGMFALGWCYALADFLQKKWVKIPEFITSIRFGLMTLFALIFGAILLTFALFLGEFWMVAGVLLFPVLGWSAFALLETGKDVKSAFWWKSLSKRVKNNIQHKRRELLLYFIK